MGKENIFHLNAENQNIPVQYKKINIERRILFLFIRVFEVSICVVNLM